MNQTEADAWYSSWTDLSHDDFSSAMYSVNSIFAKHDLAAYSLQIRNLLNPMVALPKPLEDGSDQPPHH